MSALPIASTGAAPSTFAPSNAPAKPQDADDGAPSFRQLMSKATNQPASKQADGQDDDAKPADDADTQAAQQLAMQALALAGIAAPKQELPQGTATNAGKPMQNEQLDPMGQLAALAMVGQLGPQPLGGRVPGAQAATSAAITTPATPTTAQAAAPSQAAPVPGWLAAALDRTAGSPGAKAADTAPGAKTTDAATVTDAAAAKAAAVLAAAGDPTPTTTALTPLEQAVHDLIGQISERAGTKRADKKLDELEVIDGATDPTASQAPLQPQPSPHALPGVTRAAELDPARPAMLAQPAEAPSNPSHVHLVLDDGPDRVVVTVAVRGNDIRVALRGNDDATTNALARNAASLDHAMRARGLQLSELTAEREPSQPDAQREQAQQREPRKPDKRFVLEDNL